MFGKRKRQKASTLDASAIGDLEGTTSDLTDFGSTGKRGFAEAWDESDNTESTQRQQLAESFGSTEHDSSGRDLDVRRRRAFTILVVLILAGATAGYLSQQREGEEQAIVPIPESTIALTAPGAPRTYADPEGRVRLLNDESIVDVYIRVGKSDPEPVAADDISGAPPTARFAPVLWGGRAHIAIVGTRLIDADICAVATLVTNDLGVVDLATFGACEESLTQTGDRVACSSDSLLLLEVWPADPSAVTPKPPVAGVRVRLERVHTDDTIVSRRAALQLETSTSTTDQPFLRSLLRVGGAPEDDLIIASADGEITGTCTLLDRTNATIQLLPS